MLFEGVCVHYRHHGSGACRTQGRSAQKCPIFGSDGSEGFEKSEGSNSRSIIWMHRNNGLITFGREKDLRFSYIFIFRAGFA